LKIFVKPCIFMQKFYTFEKKLAKFQNKYLRVLGKFSRQASDIVTYIEVRDKIFRGLGHSDCRRMMENSRCFSL